MCHFFFKEGGTHWLFWFVTLSVVTIRQGGRGLFERCTMSFILNFLFSAFNPPLSQSSKLVCLYPMPHCGRGCCISTDNGTKQFLVKFWLVSKKERFSSSKIDKVRAFQRKYLKFFKENLSSTKHKSKKCFWPTANLNDYFSATECPIDLKPSCIFKFVRCLEVYEKKLVNLDRGGTLEGLLSARNPQN